MKTVDEFSWAGASHMAGNRMADSSADAEPTLTASEIGSFTFCRTAWHLQRMGITRDFASAAKMELGSRAHQRLATRAVRVRNIDRIRTLMLLIIVGLAVIIVVSTLNAAGLLAP